MVGERAVVAPASWGWVTLGRMDAVSTARPAERGTAPETRPGRWRRPAARRAARHAARLVSRLTGAPWWVQVVVAFLAVRAVSALLLIRAAQDQAWFPGVTAPSPDHIDLRLSWDAQWYQRIAEDGYPSTLPLGADGRVEQNPWAFSPAFPMLVRAVTALTGTSFAAVAPWLALAASTAAAVVLARLLRDTLPAPTAGPVSLAAVTVWAAWPAAPVLQMAYTEGLSMLVLAGVLLMLVRERWWAAGALTIVLGLTRPMAAPVTAVVITAVWLRWRSRGRRPITRAEAVGLVGVVGASGAAGLVWPTVAWWGTGQRDAYTATMAAWRTGGVVEPLQPWLRTLRWAVDHPSSITVVPTIAILVALGLSLVLLVPGAAPALDLRLRVWCGAYTGYLLLVVDGTTSTVRYLTPLVPVAVLLIGAARGLPAWRRRHTVLTAGWVVAGIAAQAVWIWWIVVLAPPDFYPP